MTLEGIQENATIHSLTVAMQRSLLADLPPGSLASLCGLFARAEKPRESEQQQRATLTSPNT